MDQPPNRIAGGNGGSGGGAGYGGNPIGQGNTPPVSPHKVIMVVDGYMLQK